MTSGSLCRWIRSTSTKEQPARLLVAVTEEQLKNAPNFMTREAVEVEEAAVQARRGHGGRSHPAPRPPASNRSGLAGSEPSAVPVEEDARPCWGSGGRNGRWMTWTATSKTARRSRNPPRPPASAAAEPRNRPDRTQCAMNTEITATLRARGGSPRRGAARARGCANRRPSPACRSRLRSPREAACRRCCARVV